MHEDLRLIERRRSGITPEARETLVDRASVVLAVLAAAALAVLVPPDRPWHPWPVAILVGLAVVLSRLEFEIGAGAAVPVGLAYVPLLFTAPTSAVPLLMVVAFGLGAVRGWRSLGREVIVSVGSTWWAFGPVLVLMLARAAPPAPARFPLYVAALLAQVVCDYGSYALFVIAAGGRRPSIGSTAQVYVIDALIAPLGLAVALIAEMSAFGYLLPFPIVALLALLSRERGAHVTSAIELSETFRRTAGVLAEVVEADDGYTGAHSRGTVELVRLVAVDLGLEGTELRLAELAALLHDVGKVRIPKEIINKPGPLDQDEWASVREHPLIGAAMLRDVGGELATVGWIVRHHHERWDGDGYPDRLAGEAIPLASRIIAVCDAYSALTTDRSYRAARAHAPALAELERCAGTQFDPVVVEALVRVLGREQAGLAA